VAVPIVVVPFFTVKVTAPAVTVEPLNAATVADRVTFWACSE
jgi:hypothetical protein